jgi:tRNA A-37 threonylcarbamoyl transferase component Bud32
MTGGDLEWTLTAAGERLLSIVDRDLNSHITSGRASVVKTGQHRTVYRVVLTSGVALYWKHCRLNGSRAWWRDFFRGPKAKMEFDRAIALAERGIETVEPLAWARFRGRRPRGSFLVTRDLEDTVPLDHYLIHNPPATAALRRSFTKGLAEYVAKLHAVGVTHSDLHPGNLLIRPGGDCPRLFLIDVHDIHLGRPLSRRARLRNLTLFNRWFQLRTSRADRLRFWKVYAGPATDCSEPTRLEIETDRSVISLWDSRGGRCLRENRNFRRVRGPGVTGFAVRDLDEGIVANLFEDPDALFAGDGAKILKSSRSATVCITSGSTANGNRPMVFKRFKVTHRTDHLATLFRPPPATRSWTNGHALIDRGLPTPRPCLLLHRTQFGLQGVGYLLSELVPEAQHLHEAIDQSDPRERWRLIDRIARWIRLMHERGVSHRDLKAANILVGSDGECHFIDLVGVRTRRRVPRRVRVRDLARLNASFVSSPVVGRSDRLRFLRTYLLWGLRSKAGWKGWWREIAWATHEKVRRNERKNRPLS